MIDSGFKAETFADHVRSGQWQNRRGENRGVQQTECEQVACPRACERDQSASRVFGFVDIAMTGGVKSRRGTNDNEENDDHATDASDKDVGAGLRILAWANFFLHEASLQVEKLPRSDGGADQAGKHDQIIRTELKVGNYRGSRGNDPVRLGQERRNYVGDIKTTGEEKDDLHLTVGAFQYQRPHEDRGDGHGYIFADVENFHGGRDTGKFRDHVSQIHEKTGDHNEECGAEAELFAD